MIALLIVMIMAVAISAAAYTIGLLTAGALPVAASRGFEPTGERVRISHERCAAARRTERNIGVTGCTQRGFIHSHAAHRVK